MSRFRFKVQASLFVSIEARYEDDAVRRLERLIQLHTDATRTKEVAVLGADTKELDEQIQLFPSVDGLPYIETVDVTELEEPEDAP